MALLAEGTTNDYSLQVTLQNGLSFINDGTIDLAFISNNGITSSLATLVVNNGTLEVVGNQNSAQAQPITPDLSGAAPNAQLNPADITVTTDANGNEVITFHVGTLINNDNDPDREGVSLEFNARVENQTSNVGGTVLSASAVDLSGSANLSTPQTVREGRGRTECDRSGETGFTASIPPARRPASAPPMSTSASRRAVVRLPTTSR